MPSLRSSYDIHPFPHIIFASCHLRRQQGDDMDDAELSEATKESSHAPWPASASYDFNRSPQPLASKHAVGLSSQAKHNFFRRAEW